MIKVRIPDHFIPERTYAVNALLRDLLGLPVTILPSAACRDYRLEWGGKVIVIEDGFFGKLSAGQSYLNPAFIPDRAAETCTEGLHPIIRLFGQDRFSRTPDEIECGVDLFAGSFFMLTRWEESLPYEPDLHGRFPAEQALIVRSGFIRRPVVDEYAAWLAGWLRSMGYPVPERRYTVVPTCDVDHPRFWSAKKLLRNLAGRLIKHKRPRLLLRDFNSFRRVRQGLARDPFDRFDEMLSAAETRGLRFAFYFIAGGKTRYEGDYSPGDPDIQSLIRHLENRGHRIGLHPSYASGEIPNTIAAEKKALERVVGHDVHLSRQHYLRFTVPETWQQLAEAGIREDSSLGYAAEPGFRCGTSRPFPVFDIRQRSPLDVVERPLLIMDVSLRYYKHWTPEEALEICSEIKAQVKKHQGDLVFLWHNSTLSEVDDWSDWNTVFAFLLAP